MWARVIPDRPDQLGRGAEIGQDFLRYMAFEEDAGPGFDPLSFDFDRDPPRLSAMARLYDASNPDLSKFKARGGKLIMYSGWANENMSPFATVHYYEAVIDKMGGLAATQTFARLLMVPAHSIAAAAWVPFSWPTTCFPHWKTGLRTASHPTGLLLHRPKMEKWCGRGLCSRIRWKPNTKEQVTRTMPQTLLRLGREGALNRRPPPSSGGHAADESSGVIGVLGALGLIRRRTSARSPVRRCAASRNDARHSPVLCRWHDNSHPSRRARSPLRLWCARPSHAPLAPDRGGAVFRGTTSIQNHAAAVCLAGCHNGSTGGRSASAGGSGRN